MSRDRDAPRAARCATSSSCMVQAIILIVLAIPFGLTIDPAGLAVVLGLLALIGLVHGAALLRRRR